MELEGGCYCGEIRFTAAGDPVFKGECLCRECQYISGGNSNIIIAMPEAGFSYTKSAPKAFQRSDLDNPVTREFCADCGTHIVSKSPALPGVSIIKVGTLDDPSAFGKSEMVIYTVDKQDFHQLPPGVPAFERSPGQ